MKTLLDAFEILNKIHQIALHDQTLSEDDKTENCVLSATVINDETANQQHTK